MLTPYSYLSDSGRAGFGVRFGVLNQAAVISISGAHFSACLSLFQACVSACVSCCPASPLMLSQQPTIMSLPPLMLVMKMTLLMFAEGLAHCCQSLSKHCFQVESQHSPCNLLICSRFLRSVRCSTVWCPPIDLTPSLSEALISVITAFYIIYCLNPFTRCVELLLLFVQTDGPHFTSHSLGLSLLGNRRTDYLLFVWTVAVFILIIQTRQAKL